jgi:hypothetical protein
MGDGGGGEVGGLGAARGRGKGEWGVGGVAGWRASRADGQAPSSWPAPYVKGWGVVDDPSQPLRYGGQEAERGVLLSKAAFEGNVSLVARLLAEGASANFHDSIHVGNTPLHRAAITGSVYVCV